MLTPSDFATPERAHTDTACWQTVVVRRDRDEQGKARNARPRDGLGRPLPYGEPGVPRQEEGVVRSARDSLAEAQKLFDEGKPFHAHEVLEDAWKSGPPAERELWRGLAQLAVGLTHAARGNATGARALLARGAAAIDEFRAAPPHGVAVAGLVTWQHRVLAALDAQGALDGETPQGQALDAAEFAPTLVA